MSMHTWQDILAACPELATIETRARSGGNWHAWNKVKAKLASLIGWDACKQDNPELRTSAAYNVACDHLLDAFDAGNAARPGWADRVPAGRGRVCT